MSARIEVHARAPRSRIELGVFPLTPVHFSEGDPPRDDPLVLRDPPLGLALVQLSEPLGKLVLIVGLGDSVDAVDGPLVLVDAPAGPPGVDLLQPLRQLQLPVKLAQCEPSGQDPLLLRQQPPLAGVVQLLEAPGERLGPPAQRDEGGGGLGKQLRQQNEGRGASPRGGAVGAPNPRARAKREHEPEPPQGLQKRQKFKKPGPKPSCPQGGRYQVDCSCHQIEQEKR
mmetsp:Transcript_62152/g.140587  ORF Transcript_62152/g.140587 Transcript_62152/m.140587 type:complete len:227 (+) Transcript_62152:45-725(+)